MIFALRSEFRKLFTVRSTYLFVLLAGLMITFFAGYAEGYRATPQMLAEPHRLATMATAAISVVTMLGTLVAILLVTHEYRHGTIMYTLTASRSRLVTLIAKTIAASVFVLLFTSVMAVLSPLMNLLGIALAGNDLVPQTLYYRDLIWKCLFYGWAYGMIGLVLGMLIRNQIGAIVGFFIVPSTVEMLLSLLLKGNSMYLPTRALSHVLWQMTEMSPGKAATVVLAYIVIGWIVAAILFVRRDAN